jgi:putative holliday junction resolvase
MPSDMKSDSKVLAIDYGTKRIGLAISDELRMLARPIGVIEQSKTAIPEILDLIKREGVGIVLVGLPRTLEGTESDMTREVGEFSMALFALLDTLGVRYQFHDERLTSVMAANNLRSRGLSRAKRQEKYRHDEEAARIILQEYLDSNWSGS